MSEFYEHILELIRAVGRGMERSPGSFADAEERRCVTTCSSR